MVILLIIYAIAGYWAAGEVIYKNKVVIEFEIGALFMKKLSYGMLLGWILIPIAIISIAISLKGLGISKSFLHLIFLLDKDGKILYYCNSTIVQGGRLWLGVLAEINRFTSKLLSELPLRCFRVNIKRENKSQPWDNWRLLRRLTPTLCNMHLLNLKKRG